MAQSPVVQAPVGVRPRHRKDLLRGVLPLWESSCVAEQGFEFRIEWSFEWGIEWWGECEPEFRIEFLRRSTDELFERWGDARNTLP